MFPFAKIFKQAYHLTKTHRFLWWFGLFLIWGSFVNAISLILDPAKLASGENQHSLVNWLNTNTTQAYSLFVVVFVLGLFLLVMYFRSKASIIASTKAILDKKPSNFRLSFKSSRSFYIRIFGVWFATSFLLTLISIIMIMPITYLASLNYLGRALTLGLFAFIIFIPVSLVVLLINHLAPIFIVLHDLKIGESIKSSFDMIKKFWSVLLLFAIFLGLLSALAIVTLALFFAIIGSSFVISESLLYDGNVPVSLTILSITGILFTVLFAIIQAIIAVFIEVCWVLVFLEIVKPQKLEETQEVPVPEII